ncbi:peptidase [Sinomicrobium weinanense]|uniref:Peptidase n=1 Tax=Sinomicrobium weinanense TaxID=2842200 RepID=A0A926Q3F2_9FLAO|nr:peptidase [Sinomicrobium weinanense]MBC9795941.1 peptidase [Sinomicrobium weinanense]MBU3122060.1 hypothetical protein [Sinomicrobium weinanense]
MKKTIILPLILFSFFTLCSPYVSGQDRVFRYELDLTRKNDAFNVSLKTPQLSRNDSVYSFAAHAPGVHQPLDFGRFVKVFRVYGKDGKELVTHKISTNSFVICEPEKVADIVYEIDDSFDMSIDEHPIYPMSGTGITENYTIVNTFGVFGYFEHLKNNPVELKLKLHGSPKVGTALNKNSEDVYEIDSYYHFTDSPILIGKELSYASADINGIEVEVFAYSPDESVFSAQSILESATPVLNAATEYIGYAPVPRYTFLMYFSGEGDKAKMPVFKYGGALEHSLSSTYTLPANPRYIPFLKNNIAHEFMHILSPLHLHSDALANFDYARPASDDLHLWLYEGLTEWVSYKMQVRAGLVSFDDYLHYLSEKISKSEQYSADYSLTRLSREWSTDEGNKQYNNIYQLGALTAAMLDIKLLQLSGGKKGLREVYLELIKKYGKDHPFNNETFFDTLVEMTYPEIRDFIDKHIKDNTAFDFEKEMRAVGIHYYLKPKSGEELYPEFDRHVFAIDPDASPEAAELREKLK